MSISPRLHIAESHKAKMELARNRLMAAIFIFIAAFSLIGWRMLDLGLGQQVAEASSRPNVNTQILASRVDIVDRNGVVLATNLQTASLYANPRAILEPKVAAERIVAVLPDLSQAKVYAKLTSRKSFSWIKRKLTPREKWQVNALGIPGLGFQTEEQRIYPQGPMASHVLGYVDVDGKGLSGIERFFDNRLSDPAVAGQPLVLSLDARVQHALSDELNNTIERFSAIGGAGVVLDVVTGEVLALVSMPDFDPNHAGSASRDARFNRATAGVYELGSIFKTFTLAMALENGVAKISDSYDARKPIRIASFSIKDDHPQNRILTLPEIFVYSSNIGAAKIAMDVGGEEQRSFLQQLGMLRPATIELGEVGWPLYPERWRDINTMTISYGHGIAISPLQLAVGSAAMVNGGQLITATLIKDHDPDYGDRRRIISESTSEQIRAMMRSTVKVGTGRSANVDGYRVGGKTGTAEKPDAGGYKEDALMSSFLGVFPMDEPRYLVLVSVDEPQGIAETFNFASAGWVAAPLVKNIITRIGPILGIAPSTEEDPRFQQAALLIDSKKAN
jgi:cell division protein FtsI (penicillin-binding protein 3)